MTTVFSFRCTFRRPKIAFAQHSRTFISHSTCRTFAAMAIRPAPESVAKEAAANIHQPRDPNTLSNYNAFRTKHTEADFEIDFNAKRLKGTVHLTLEKLVKDASKVILDSR